MISNAYAIQQKFILDNRFLIDPFIHSITDLVGGSQDKLEPRVLHLLCILASNKGNVVKRDFFIQEIWNNYGGADEGLSQGISFLRKSLMDSDKRMITTIPKQGYILNCMVTFPELTASSQPITNKPNYTGNYSRVWLSAGLVLMFVIGVLIITGLYRRPDDMPVVTLPIQSMQSNTTANQSYAVSYPQIKEHDLDNESNSIRTVDKNGNQYLLEIYGDERPRFYVNDKLVNNTEPYKNLINHLQKILWSKGRRKF